LASAGTREVPGGGPFGCSVLELFDRLRPRHDPGDVWIFSGRTGGLVGLVFAPTLLVCSLLALLLRPVPLLLTLVDARVRAASL
jgi:hypothetical protein